MPNNIALLLVYDKFVTLFHKWYRTKELSGYNCRPFVLVKIIKYLFAI